MAALEVLVILVVALGASLLTFYSGFGLGTLLLPAFALAFPLDVAVAATAVVHLANNMGKTALVGRSADRGVVLRFGLPALVAAIVGALLLLALDDRPLATYDLAGPREVTPLGLVVGGLVTLFAIIELAPRLRDIAVDRRWLVPGGLASGLFGGLSGHQGALRSMFLVRVLPDAKTFVATGTVVAVLVDLARLAVYAPAYAAGAAGMSAGDAALVGGAVAFALTGALVGSRLLHKITLGGVRLLVGVLLLVLGPAIAVGLV